MVHEIRSNGVDVLESTFCFRKRPLNGKNLKLNTAGKKHLFGLLLIHLCSSYTSSFIFQCVTMATQ